MLQCAGEGEEWQSSEWWLLVGSSEVEVELEAGCDCNWEEPVGWSERDGEGARINSEERDCHSVTGTGRGEMAPTPGPPRVKSGPHDLHRGGGSGHELPWPGPAHGLQVQGLKGM